MKHPTEIRKTTWELKIKEFSGSITKARAWAKLTKTIIDPVTGNKTTKESKEIFVVTGYLGRTSTEVREYLGTFHYIVFKVAFLDNNDNEIAKEEQIHDKYFDCFDVHCNCLQRYSVGHSTGIRFVSFV